jgi:NAD(P)-dependent dehydrogenase (short-subunit alcohol dehydrogenase family)
MPWLGGWPKVAIPALRSRKSGVEATAWPEDVARLVFFLAADDREAMTDQSTAIDGGECDVPFPT